MKWKWPLKSTQTAVQTPIDPFLDPIDPSQPTPQDPTPASVAIAPELPDPQALEALVTELTQPDPDPTPIVPPVQRAKTWIKQHPWIFLPLLGVFPAIGWSLDTLQPKPSLQATAIALTQPSIAPSPINSPKPSPTPAAKPTLPPPVDLSKLTPAQKEMNRKAKALLEATNAPVDAYIEMKVGIARGGVLVIASSSKATVTDDKGKKLASMSAGEVYTAQADGQGLTLGTSQLPAAVFIEPEPGGLLYVSNRAYRGKLLLAIDKGQVQAVNYIDLRHYLYSVVASEVSPSWSPEALKAQAVAARSYALTYYFRPANPLYQLGNDEYFQVYSGIEKEDDRTNQAVDMTAGEYVSYKGGIVESLYAASDDIVAEAFAGRGMSQLGALSLAEKGYQYQQILGTYYPGTKVGRIAQDY